MALSRAPQTVLPGAVPGMEQGKGKSLVKPLPAPPPQQPGIGMAPPGGPSQVGMRPQPVPGMPPAGAGGLPGMRPPPMGLPGVGLDMGGGMSSRIGLGQQMGPAMSGFRQQPMAQDMRKQALMQLLGGGG